MMLSTVACILLSHLQLQDNKDKELLTIKSEEILNSNAYQQIDEVKTIICNKVGGLHDEI